MPAKAPNRNYLRILDKSMEMFNQDGVIRVTVQNIAEALSISPGNVTYHFKKKVDIVHAILDRLERELIELLDRGIHLKSKVDPEEHYELVVSISRLLWRYRFIFNFILYLNSLDPKFGERFKLFQEHVTDAMMALVDQSINNGWIKKSRAPRDRRLLSDNLWYIWLSAIRVSELEPDNGKNSEQRSVVSALKHHMSYMENYYDEKMYQEWDAYLARIDTD